MTVPAYQVVAPMVNATTATNMGPTKLAYLKGSVLPESVPDHQIQHLLSIRAIRPVGGGNSSTAAEPEPAAEVVSPGSEGGDTVPDSGTSPEPDPEPNTSPDGDTTPEPGPDSGDGEVEAQRAEARSKLDAAGGKPTGRHGQPVWVEHLVNLGYAYEAVAKESKDELVRLAEQVQA